MGALFQLFREYPAVGGISLFVLVSLILMGVLATLMHQAGVSLKPIVFFAGFLAIVGVPQGVVHVLDALAHRSAVTNQRSSPETPATNVVAEGGGEVRPVAWETVFGPEADPALITDARRGLDAVLGTASEARISFDVNGGSALAARFESVGEAALALTRYGAFFQFAQVSGSDVGGWTGKRYGGQGEWNHVLTAGNELYAWTGATKESVEARRVHALGPLPVGGTEAASFPALPRVVSTASRTGVSDRLSRNTPVMLVFLVINVGLAGVWFFKGSAWSARIAPIAGVPPLDLSALGERLMALAHAGTGVEVIAGADGRTWEIGWRHADARWIDWMRVHRNRQTHKLSITLDEAHRTARVREYWSAFDASAGPDRLRFNWNVATGIQFFRVDHRRTVGLQLDARGRPTGELSTGMRFDLQALKSPVIEAVTGGGWTWQPVVWNVPEGLRWLAE